jgi:hypothetical protein
MKRKSLLTTVALAFGFAAMLPGTAPNAEAQTAIPAALRVTSGVDTSSPGVLIRTYQVEGFDTQGQLTTVERLLAGELGPNIANLSDPNYTYDAARGYFVLGGDVGLNFRHDAGDGGDNGQFVGPNYPDRPIPGLPGTTFTADQAAAEAIVFLEFKAAGLFEMGVSSDDSFKLTTWHNPRDRFALTLGQFNGTRGMTESRVILFNIPEPGIYPFRCLWANATGATGWEWYLFDPAGNRNLINDATNTVAVAYREGPLRPYVQSVFPDIGAANVSPAADIIAELVDETIAVNGGSIQLTVNDGAVIGTQTITKDGTKTTVKFTPANPLALGTTNTARLVYSDTSNPPLTVTNTWSFVTTQALIPPAAAVPPGQVDQTALGFRLFVHQLDGVEFDNGAALENIRDQLEGIRGANLADLSGADANGYFFLTNPLGGGTNVVNLNNFYQVGEKGNFTSNNGFPDLTWPGTPGAGGLDWNADNLATEILTFVEFPAPGGYTMGIKSWDSFAVTVGDAAGRSPKDLFATVLGEYDGDAPGNYLFSFYVPEAGIYPVRLIHNIGIQQGDLEWFTVDPSGTLLTLISAPGGLKSYPRGPALPAYVRRVSPGANIAGIQDVVVTDVLPGTPIFAEIRDDGTTVSPGNATLTLNGGGQSSATKANGITTVTMLNVPDLAPGSEHTASLVYTDSAGKTFTNSWKFRMADAFRLDPALSYPLGSGDPTKRGFAMRVVQLPLAFVSGENGSVTKSEAMLAGAFLGGTNVANLDDNRYPLVDGWWQVPTINFGNGRGLITEDEQVPGIPGLTGHTTHYAAEIRAYVEFPRAGLYNMTIHSDDSPRLFQAEAQRHHFGAVEIVEPCERAGTRIAMSATRTSIGSGFGVDLPTEPLVLNLVLADPLLGETALNNAAAAKDSAVLVKRGAVAFGVKAANAKAAGARAVIVFNDESADRPDRPPIFMGGTATGVDIPCLFIGHRDGTNLVNLLQAGPVKVNLQENPAPSALVPNDGFFGQWDFAVFAPQPGVYPLRLVTGQGGGDYSIEWTVLKADDTHVLLNTADDPEALKAFRSVTVRPQMLTPTLGDSCNEVQIHWRGSGKLLEANTVTGPYTPSANQSMPHVEPAGRQKYFRVEQMK